MPAISTLSAAIAKGREQGDDRKLKSAQRAISRDPKKARLDDKRVHDRAITKQVRLAHEAVTQADRVLNVILDVIETATDMPAETKQRLITLGDTTAADRERYEAKLAEIDTQAASFKKDGGTDPLMWTIGSLGICSTAESSRTDFIKIISDTYHDVNQTIENLQETK